MNKNNLENAINGSEDLTKEKKDTLLLNNELIKNNFSTLSSSLSLSPTSSYNTNSGKNFPQSSNRLTRNAILSCLSSQTTAKILQQIISEESKETIEIIVNELKGTFREIIKDKNGNYFCSDLFKLCNQNQRLKILNELSKNFSEDSTHKFATYPLQILIEFSSSEEEYKLILRSFYDYKQLLLISFNPIGAYVVQKIIEHIPEKFRYQFNLIFITIIPQISQKQFGLCCCKKFFSFSKNEDTIEKAINIICQYFIQISTNNFGNFLIQFIFKKLNNTKLGERIKEEIINNYNILSKNKYSYYICDLFSKLATKDDIMKVIFIHDINPLNIKHNNNNIEQNFSLPFLNNNNDNFNITLPNNIPFSFNNFNMKQNNK